MKIFVHNVAHWDIFFAKAIFGLNGRKILSFTMPWISHSGNGYYYPVIPAVLLLFDSQKAWCLFAAGLFSYAIELPVYKLLKNSIKRNRPCEVLSDVHGHISSSDKFTLSFRPHGGGFCDGHAAQLFFPDIVNAVVFLGLVGGIFPHLSWCPLSHGYTGGANHRPAQCLDRTNFCGVKRFSIGFKE